MLQGPQPEVGAARVPKWEMLHRELLQRIGKGEFSNGFPGEHELSQTYDVSRHTVREALRRLREAGLLDSARGRVTQVRPKAIEQNLGGLYSLFREVEAQGHVQRSDVITISLTTEPLAANALGIDISTEFFHLERLRRSDGEPLAHDKVWIPSAIAAPLMEADFTHAALYDELTRRCGVRPTGGSERIAAVMPTAAQRGLLELDRGIACFDIERHGRVRDQPPIEYRRSLVRADRYALLTSWTPNGFRLGASADAPPHRDGSRPFPSPIRPTP